MSELIAAQGRLSQAQQARLAQVVGVLIPASEALGVPGADDASILAEIVAAAAPLTAPLGEALAVLDDMALTRHDASFDALGRDQQAALIEAFGASGSRHARLIASLVLPCYYRDERVVRSLGEQPRPPFPDGYEVEQGDFSLLDAVRERGPIWRVV